MSNAIQKIEDHLFSPQVLSKFVGVLDKSATPYIRSVIIAVEADYKLQKCTPESIGISALRAASLQLSCDPSVKQAYLVPYWNNKKNAYEAQFIPHYLGLYALAVRTNKYRVINVTPFPASYHLELDLTSGNSVIVNEHGVPAVYAPKVDPKEAGAWYGYLRTRYNFEKKIWMTKEEIHKHASTFNPKGYNADGSLWKNKDQVHTMEMKTVLRELLNWADKSGYGDNTLREALKTDDVIDVEATDEEVTPPEVKEDEVVATEVKEEAPKVEEQKDEPVFGFNNGNIVIAVAKVLGYDNNTAYQTVKEAHDKGLISDKLTVSAAKKFAEGLLK